MSTIVTKAEARVAAAVAESTSRTAALIAGLSQILAVIVGFGILNSTESGAIINVAVAGINAGGFVVYILHTGKISPTAVETHLLALVAAAASLGVSFAIWGQSTATIVIAAVTTVGGALAQIVHAYLSRTVPTPTPPVPAPAPVGKG